MMKISVNSDEFRAWHEVGHATVCLHLGGGLDGIEFLEGNARAFAVAHCCDVMPDMERSVACGGFAAEFYLLQAGYVDWVDLQGISAIVFSNAWSDRQDFAGRTVTEDNDFTKQEDEEFMHHAIQIAAPIVEQHFSRMKNVVSELLAARKIDGARVKELLQLGT
ncbi:hypothetical protein [Polaromonas sp. JS666]|uniref:hypothetical protein n=1 Tax=Polaromonas sp. (strain JS666 / ATCC BAA-500) TaxID=296591 RepID=UPI0009443EF7|nr:hypothetical protein [Polaromonas sp. JS666]